uniref:Cytochrome c biogenesis protein n=1 Tax=Cryptomonas gyropyrenoidosa TaxID=233257 RepID=UPI002797D361|nr:Cytochrome c biogenesis protein [Cryptomonas gyropyrenoidosa]WFQ82932.1 Cytochrome c biogenesis protein [Cryptomonas gyropyrenoidosa]
MKNISSNSVISTVWRTFYTLGNLKFAITLLLCIAFITSIGTVVEQDRSESFYKINYPEHNPALGFLSYNLILFLGLDHVYKTFWFFSLLIIFVLSLFSCTLARQIPSMKLAKLWRFFKRENFTRVKENKFLLKDSSLNHLSYLLRTKGYNIIQQNSNLYAYKGFIGKVGPIIVHFSIILVLFGSVYGILTGYMAQEIIQKGDLFYPQNFISKGILASVKQDFVSYVKDFKIAYSDQGSVDQFYSELQTIDPGLKINSKRIIFVNQPFRYKGVTFYQTDWAISSLQFLDDNGRKSIARLKEISIKNGLRFWIGPVKTKNSTEKFLLLEDLTGNCLISTKEKKILGLQEIGSKIFLNGKVLRVQKIIPATGLQLKLDPGVPIIYTGFFILIFSVFSSYLSYSQVWALKEKNNLYIYAMTNRGLYFFEKFLISTLQTLRKK